MTAARTPTSNSNAGLPRTAGEFRAAERRVTDHVLRLLDDRRFMIPTSIGVRPVGSLQRNLSRWDRALHVKRLMADLDRPDFELQDSLPKGEGFDVRLSRQVLLAFSQPLAHLRYASLPPLRELIKGDPTSPLSADAVRRAVSDLPSPAGDKASAGAAGGPMTLILFCAAGFADDARRVAREFVDGPPTILIEPDEVGGFRVSGPPGSEVLQLLLDPEQEHERAHRIAKELDRRDVELLTGGVSLDDVAHATNLPVAEVEHVATAWANRQALKGGDTLRVKRVAGSPMLYRDSSLSPSRTANPTYDEPLLSLSASTSSMPVMDRIRRLLGKGVSTETKIAQLAEQRAALSRQRDRVYEDMARLEEREQELRDAFTSDESTSTRRRITSQIVQLQKDLERRRQTVGMLNQQINVVGTHLHNLEIARTGAGKLPKSEEIAEDAAKAEEVLAELQASSELADELSSGMSISTGSDEEERLYKELTAQADAQKGSGSTTAPASNTPAFAREIPAIKPKAKPASESNVDLDLPEEADPFEEADAPRRTEPEAN